MTVTTTPKPVLILRNVIVDIPINTQETRILKKALVSSLTGGTLFKSKHGVKIEALKNIDCTIYHGDRVALIGHNGAGKSTFLRLISGIYKPTSGFFQASCIVHPMIQKNFITGPELSGIQAAKGHYLYINDTLDGFDVFLNDIIEFSELGDFIHLPLKTYSEGMSARLLFALLTSGSHDCIALDEGFGAGDLRFIERAEKRLENFINSSGTLILASHSDALLRQFCNRGLVFRHGEIVYDGHLEDALHVYYQSCH